MGGGGGARNPPGSHGGASLEKFGNHCCRASVNNLPLHLSHTNKKAGVECLAGASAHHTMPCTFLVIYSI